jgi:hypothetical protein
MANLSIKTIVYAAESDFALVTTFFDIKKIFFDQNHISRSSTIVDQYTD